MMAAELGFDGIGVFRRKLLDYGLDEAADRLEQSKLAITSLGWAGGFTGSDGCGFEEAIVDADEAIEQAAMIGAQTLIVIAGGLNNHIHKHAARTLCGALKKLAPIASQNGVTLSIEPIHPGCGDGWSFLHDLASAFEIVQRVNHPSVGLVCDLYHIGLQPNPTRLLAEATPYINLVQIADGKCCPDGEMNRCLCGRGTIPIAEMVRSLRQNGYAGPWEIEILGEDVEMHPYTDILKHSRDYMLDLLS